MLSSSLWASHISQRANVNERDGVFLQAQLQLTVQPKFPKQKRKIL